VTTNSVASSDRMLFLWTGQNFAIRQFSLHLFLRCSSKIY